MIGLVPGTFLGGVFLRRDFAGNTPPLASLTFTPNIIRAGDVVSFNASSSRDPDGSITHYAWNFGDGATAIGVLAVHTYNRQGNFTLRLQVTDDGGATSSTSVNLSAIARSIFNETLVLDPVYNTGVLLFVFNLFPQQPVNVTFATLTGNFTAGVDFSVLGPCSSGQCPQLKDYTTSSAQGRTSFILDSSNPKFLAGEYQVDIRNYSTTDSVTVYLNLARV